MQRRDAGAGPLSFTAMGTTSIGEIGGGGSPRLDRFCAELAAAGLEAQVHRDIMSLIWTKFALNCSVNALAAATGLRAGEFSRVPATDRLQDILLDEILAVARAKGITLTDPDFRAKVKTHSWNKYNRPSMLQHVESGRRTEIDALNARLVEEGRRLGVPTPLQRRARLHTEGRRVQAAGDRRPHRSGVRGARSRGGARAPADGAPGTLAQQGGIMRKLKWVLLSVVLGWSLTASAQVKITMWSHWAAEKIKRDYVEDAIKRFEAANPGIKIEASWYEKTALYAALKTALRAGTAPDFFYAEPDQFEYMENGLLLDLSPLNWAAIEPWAKEAWSYKGKPYGVPLEAWTVEIYYNRKTLGELGVKVPASLQLDSQAFLDLAKKARAKNATPMSLGVGDRPYPGAHLTHEALLKKLGVQDYDNLLRASCRGAIRGWWKRSGW